MDIDWSHTNVGCVAGGISVRTERNAVVLIDMDNSNGATLQRQMHNKPTHYDWRLMNVLMAKVGT